MDKHLKDKRRIYKEVPNVEIQQYQLKKFNEIWKEIINEVPYYKELVDKERIPSQIKSIDDFIKLPITDRKEVRNNVLKYSNNNVEPDFWITTGGSTGTPLKFPSRKKEKEYYEPSIWYARDFYGIKRSDRMFRLWGHSHTLGKGFSKYKKILSFKIGHPLIGFKRFSAYNLSKEQLRKAGEEILKFKPDYIIGYSKAINMLAKVNEGRKNEFHKLNLRAVIGASEAFDTKEDREFVSEVFGCEVGLEYASMETKHIAHTYPKSDYKVLWDDVIMECVDENGLPSTTGRVLITTLYPRMFPLVRYELGDIIVNTKKSGHSVYEFEEIKGRDNDFLKIDAETSIHSEALTHAIKLSDKISSYQIRYDKNNNYTIYVTSNDNINEKEKKEIQYRLNNIDSR